MPNSLLDLIALERGLVPTVQPVLPSFFEPVAPQHFPSESVQEEPTETTVSERRSLPPIEREPYRGNLNPTLPRMDIVPPRFSVARENNTPVANAPAPETRVTPALEPNLESSGKSTGEPNPTPAERLTNTLLPLVTIIRQAENAAPQPGTIQPIPR